MSLQFCRSILCGHTHIECDGHVSTLSRPSIEGKKKKNLWENCEQNDQNSFKYRKLHNSYYNCEWMHGKFHFMGNEQFRNSSLKPFMLRFFFSLLSCGCVDRKKRKKDKYYETNVNYHIIFSYYYYVIHWE